MIASAKLKIRALELGFDLVGITLAQPSPTLDAYFKWVEADMHGTMNYMGRPDRQARRRDLTIMLPGVRSLVMVGIDYGSRAVPDDILQDPSRGRIAAYAWGLDYHDILTARLNDLAGWLQQESGHLIEQRVYVDTGPLLERSHAHQAGLGFTGKNTMLIHPRRGSNFFIGEIMTGLEFDSYDSAGRTTQCGTCNRCLKACPTNAFPRPHVLDSRRCISYLTIEHKGFIESSLRPLMGNWVYGCDVCQDVCPFQRFATASREPDFYPANVDHAAPKLVDLLALDDTLFHQRYYGSPIHRIKRERLVRNACVAAGNWGHADAILPLQRLLGDSSPLIRSHAAWALHRAGGSDSDSILGQHLLNETDTHVQEEIRSLLESGQ